MESFDSHSWPGPPEGYRHVPPEDDFVNVLRWATSTPRNEPVRRSAPPKPPVAPTQPSRANSVIKLALLSGTFMVAWYALVGGFRDPAEIPSGVLDDLADPDNQVRPQ